MMLALSSEVLVGWTGVAPAGIAVVMMAAIGDGTAAAVAKTAVASLSALAALDAPASLAAAAEMATAAAVPLAVGPTTATVRLAVGEKVGIVRVTESPPAPGAMSAATAV